MTTFEKYLTSHIEQLANKYKYRVLPKYIREQTLQLYIKHLPKWLSQSGNPSLKLYTLSGTLISNGFTRVVVGDYGAYVEISKEQIVRNVLCCEKGQEYRFRDPNFKDSVKYYWYTAKDGSGVKIYYQQKQVKYADYKEGYFYISPYEISLNNL